jgi:hypothetical protein
VAVAVALAVGLVVLVHVGDQICEREAVVHRDEIHPGRRLATGKIVDFGRAGDLAGERPDMSRLATPEIADFVTVGIVPLAELLAETADTVAARPWIPRFGDQLALAQHRIGLDHLQHLGIGIESRLAPEDRRKVEPEPGNPRLLDPVAEALDHQSLRRGVVAAQGVAGSGVVDQHLLAVDFDMPVVGQRIEPLEAEHRPHVVAFAGVVVDDVEND